MTSEHWNAGDDEGDFIDDQDATPNATCVKLLNRLRSALLRYVVLPGSGEYADTVVLWIAATHVQSAWAHAPRLVIKAPEKRCGKSRLLDVIEATCHDALITVNASPAAVYRAIGEKADAPPTLLVDEADAIFGSRKAAEAHEDLRGLLNAGHQRNRPALRYDAASRRVEKIPTFAMAALAGIGDMPATIEDRAVIIPMRRRAPGETVAAYRHRRDAWPLHALRDALSNCFQDLRGELAEAEPDMPVEDRAADTWEPLIAIADAAGDDWPARARRAALALTSAAEDTDDGMSLQLRLLADCRTAFNACGSCKHHHEDGEYRCANPGCQCGAPIPLTAMRTATLLALLKADEDAPWADLGSAGLTARRMGEYLRHYGIKSRNLRDQGGQAKGYEITAFHDAWSRYLPPQKTEDGYPSHPSQHHPPSSARDGTSSGTDEPVPTGLLLDVRTVGTDGTEGSGNLNRQVRQRSWDG